jgi:hypothetical protein
MIDKDLYIVPAALKYWAEETVKANRHLLKCLKKYPNPRGVARDIVPTIRHFLTNMTSTNKKIVKILPGWLGTRDDIVDT